MRRPRSPAHRGGRPPRRRPAARGLPVGVAGLERLLGRARAASTSGTGAPSPACGAVVYDETEFCVILEGRVRLEGPGGAVEFGPGDAFVIEGGFAGTWESIGRVTKLYAILEP